MAVSVTSLAAQTPTGTLRIEVRTAAGSIVNVDILVNGTLYLPDSEGVLIVDVPPGPTDITAMKEGYTPVTTTVRAVASQEQRVVIELTLAIEEHVTVIASTRTDRRIDDQPMRVEVLEREEIEEKDAHDARRHRHDAERDGRHARPGDVPFARRGERSRPGHARPLHAVSLRRTAAVRRRSAALGCCRFLRWIWARSK